ncbi:MAG: FtsX-like permease family protein [Gemmatimonadales bacterium]|nr:FtsX-like permease family protein [Gemmatimonadales bacterium]NIN10718.1 FtsX-like permease family protein [Gemmatimonadales bacterium]NIN49430.1 FtsX-like permease family protein [Gemmatimonadales bacterium]NIP06894.1 FtsX-like permease family protein [Gemmatimonadales bacterium]NIR01577.1 FtsX-like permease family protein [Gemmatimonadales bacterium]
MPWLRGLIHRITMLLGKNREAQELDEEIQFHLEQDIRRNVLAGMDEVEARRQARLRFGGVENIKEQVRDETGVRWIEDLIQDVRLALRSSRRTPGFTAIAVLTIALGVSATSAIFSVVNGVLLNPLPHEDAEQLVVLWETDRRYSPPATRVNVSGANFADWRELARSFEGIGAYSIGTATLTGLAEPEIVNRAWVTTDFLPLLRARPVLGRVFVVGEDSPDGDAVVVLSHQFWQARFGGEQDVIGRTVTLNSAGFEIVGVLKAGVDFLARGVQVWTPIRLAQSDLENRRDHNLNVLARMRPHVSLEQAQVEMDAIADRVRLEHAEWMTERGVNVVPLRDELVGSVRPTLLVLLGGATLVLLIATVNVAGLLLVRSIGRRREFAVQSALGAGRGRLIRQTLTESLTLSLMGGALGLALATAGTNALLALAPNNIPRVDEVGLDIKVLGFAIGISVFTGAAVGLFCALQPFGTSLSEALTEGGRWATCSSRKRLRQALVIGEMALSMILLIGAGLLTQTFWRLVSIDPGFTSEHILTARFRLPQNKYPDNARMTTFYNQLLNEVRAMPQVNSAAMTRFLPLSDGPWTFSFAVEGQPPALEGEKRTYGYHPISTDYFRTAGITLLHGRDLTETDNADAAPVLIINDAMKRQFWPDENPIGTRIRFDRDGDEGPWREIVGIVRNVRHHALHIDPRPTLYGPQSQASAWMSDRMRLLVRTSSDPFQLAPTIRNIVSGLDPNLPVIDVQSMDQIVAGSVARPRFSMLLQLTFAIVAGVLALIGVYGAISYSVRQRTAEFGLRIALGAPSGAIGRLVLSQGMALSCTGIGIGVLGALFSTRLLKGLLFGVSAADPLTYGVLAILLGAAAALACYIPSRRATAADPMVALRAE